MDHADRLCFVVKTLLSFSYFLYYKYFMYPSQITVLNHKIVFVNLSTVNETRY
jgi:hypothetical protein